MKRNQDSDLCATELKTQAIGSSLRASQDPGRSVGKRGQCSSDEDQGTASGPIDRAGKERWSSTAITSSIHKLRVAREGT